MKKFLGLMTAIFFTFAFVGCALAADKVKFDKKLLKQTELTASGEIFSPGTVMAIKPGEITIFGDPEISQEDMVRYIKKRNPNPKINCTVEELVGYYYAEGKREGIRPDIAICQAIKETGTWNYGGDVSPNQNNYCGLGATGNKVAGAIFPTPEIGARAHIQHLLAYTSKRKPRTEIVDPRYELIATARPHIFGKIFTWTGLNGLWAVPGHHYGEDIINLWQQAGGYDKTKVRNENIEETFSDPSARAEAYANRALSYYNDGDFKIAEENFLTALKYDSNLPDIFFNLAMTQEKLKKFDDAIQNYDKFIELAPDDERGYYNRGRLEMDLKKYKDALKDFQSGLKIEDRLADAQNNIAVTYFRMKKYNEAWDAMQKAAEINTTNKTINENKERFEACIKKKKK